MISYVNLEVNFSRRWLVGQQRGDDAVQWNVLQDLDLVVMLQQDQLTSSLISWVILKQHYLTVHIVADRVYVPYTAVVNNCCSSQHSSHKDRCSNHSSSH
jgi:hypothetical protein